VTRHFEYSSVLVVARHFPVVHGTQTGHNLPSGRLVLTNTRTFPPERGGLGSSLVPETVGVLRGHSAPRGTIRASMFPARAEHITPSRRQAPFTYGSFPLPDQLPTEGIGLRGDRGPSV
jgi:hypothetical protein